MKGTVDITVRDDAGRPLVYITGDVDDVDTAIDRARAFELNTRQDWKLTAYALADTPAPAPAAPAPTDKGTT